jgi:BirA family biotin operon repressor/biotin-[acetyl-CoA-carboxylase] ligase
VSKKRLTPIARELRSKLTDAEGRLWSQLRGRGLLGRKFVRQFAIGDAIADFACRRARLVVELDGGQHADSLADEERTQIIEAHGYRVIRFWNNDVHQNMDGVLAQIATALEIARSE